MRLNECHGEIKYRGGKAIQRWRGSSGNVRLSHLQISFLFYLMETVLICDNGSSQRWHQLSVDADVLSVTDLVTSGTSRRQFERTVTIRRSDQRKKVRRTTAMTSPRCRNLKTPAAAISLQGAATWRI